MGERSGLFYKYSKISQQQKFHLVCLVVRERCSIKEVLCLRSRRQEWSASTTPLPKLSSSSTATTSSPTSSTSLAILGPSAWLPSSCSRRTHWGVSPPRLFLSKPPLSPLSKWNWCAQLGQRSPTLISIACKPDSWVTVWIMLVAALPVSCR